MTLNLTSFPSLLALRSHFPNVLDSIRTRGLCIYQYMQKFYPFYLEHSFLAPISFPCLFSHVLSDSTSSSPSEAFSDPYLPSASRPLGFDSCLHCTTFLMYYHCSFTFVFSKRLWTSWVMAHILFVFLCACFQSASPSIQILRTPYMHFELIFMISSP